MHDSDVSPSPPCSATHAAHSNSGSTAHHGQQLLQHAPSSSDGWPALPSAAASADPWDWVPAPGPTEAELAAEARDAALRPL